MQCEALVKDSRDSAGLEERGLRPLTSATEVRGSLDSRYMGFLYVLRKKKDIFYSIPQTCI